LVRYKTSAENSKAPKIVSVKLIILGVSSMKFAQLFILVLAFFMVKPAQAGLLIEPVLGYSFGKIQTDTQGSTEEKGNGLSYGGRLGYQKLGFQLGLDYLNSTYGMKDEDFTKDLSASEWALFAGFEFPVLARVYAGYIFSANGETAYDNNKITLSDGTGVKLGVGFTLLPFLDINVEYRKGTYSKFKQAGVGSMNVDTDFNAFMLGVSLPFVL
jgi:hypothetical protein